MTVSFDWVTDDTHAFLSGATGAGKTTLSRQLHAESGKVSIYWNHLKLDGIEGYTVHSIGELKGALRQGYDLIDYHPPWQDDEARDEFIDVVDLLFRLADRLPAVEWQLVVDEIHNYAGKNEGSPPAARVWKEGRNANIRGIGLSQEPETVHGSILRQSGRTVWLGQVPAWSQDYMERVHAPVDKINQNGEHDAALLNQNMEFLGRFRASEEYV